MWVAILQAAEEWGTPPWVIEEQASQEWWDRWAVMREEEAMHQKRQAEKK